MKKLILYLFFTFLFLIPFDTFAYTNLDTSTSFDIYQEDFSDSFYNDATYQDLLTYLSSLSTTYKDISITYNKSYHRIVLSIYPKNTTVQYYLGLATNSLRIETGTTVNRLFVTFDVNTTANFFGSTVQTKIENCLNNNNCWSSSSFYFDTTVHFDKSSYAQSFQNYMMLRWSNALTLDNNSSYVLSDFEVYQYFYYSSMNNVIYYPQTVYDNTYIKKIIINGIELEAGDRIPNYVDLSFPDDDNSLLSFNSLQPFLIGGIDKNNISNFKFDLGFNYLSKDYVESIRPYFYYFGRVDNGTYFSYKQLNCNGLGYSYAFDTDNNYVNASYLYNGFSCTDDLTDIDKIYIRVDFNYDTTNNYNTYVYNLTYNVNGAYGKFFNYSTYITPYGYTIYEKFDNFDDSSSILTSTNQDSSTVQYFSNNNNTVFVNVNRDTLKVGQVSYNPLSFGSLYNTNGMIFNYPNNDNIDTTLELLFKPDVILSFKTIVNNHDTYTYYDNNNSLTTNTIDNNVIIAFDNAYDTDYYNNIVSNYIDGLRDSIIEFSNLTQQFYDKLPDVFKTFIYVLFIMFCFYFTYLIIKR